MPEQRRLPELDGLRGIAILMVFLYHAADTHLPLFWAGVDLFFVLSGYLITGVLLRLKERSAVAGATISSAWKIFYLRRARRILPPYAGFLLAASLVYTIPWAHVWYFYLLFNANLATVLDQIYIRALVPLWSLAVEEQFYFVWPLFVFLFKPRILKKVTLGVMLAVPVLRAICTGFASTNAPIYFLAPFRIDTLAFGAYIAIAQQEEPAWLYLNRRKAVCAAATAAALFCVLSISTRFRLTANSVGFNMLGYSLIAIALTGTLVAVLTSQNALVKDIVTSRPLRYLGLISYTFYLYHYGVLSLLFVHVHSRVATAFLGFGITGIIAAISWRFLEAPILGTASGLQAARRPGVASGSIRAAASIRS